MEHSPFVVALQTASAGWFTLTRYVSIPPFINRSKEKGDTPLKIGPPVLDLNHCVVGIFAISSFASVWMAV